MNGEESEKSFSFATPLAPQQQEERFTQAGHADALGEGPGYREDSGYGGGGKISRTRRGGSRNLGPYSRPANRPRGLAAKSTEQEGDYLGPFGSDILPGAAQERDDPAGTVGAAADRGGLRRASRGDTDIESGSAAPKSSGWLASWSRAVRGFVGWGKSDQASQNMDANPGDGRISSAAEARQSSYPQDPEALVNSGLQRAALDPVQNRQDEEQGEEILKIPSNMSWEECQRLTELIQSRARRSQGGPVPSSGPVPDPASSGPPNIFYTPAPTHAVQRAQLSSPASSRRSPTAEEKFYTPPEKDHVAVSMAKQFMGTRQNAASRMSPSPQQVTILPSGAARASHSPIITSPSGSLWSPGALVVPDGQGRDRVDVDRQGMDRVGPHSRTAGAVQLYRGDENQQHWGSALPERAISNFPQTVREPEHVPATMQMVVHEQEEPQPQPLTRWTPLLSPTGQGTKRRLSTLEVECWQGIGVGPMRRVRQRNNLYARPSIRGSLAFRPPTSAQVLVSQQKQQEQEQEQQLGLGEFALGSAEGLSNRRRPFVRRAPRGDGSLMAQASQPQVSGAPAPQERRPIAPRVGENIFTGEEVPAKSSKMAQKILDALDFMGTPVGHSVPPGSGLRERRVEALSELGESGLGARGRRSMADVGKSPPLGTLGQALEKGVAGTTPSANRKAGKGAFRIRFEGDEDNDVFGAPATTSFSFQEPASVAGQALPSVETPKLQKQPSGKVTAAPTAAFTGARPAGAATQRAEDALSPTASFSFGKPSSISGDGESSKGASDAVAADSVFAFGARPDGVSSLDFGGSSSPPQSKDAGVGSGRTFIFKPSSFSSAREVEEQRKKEAASAKIVPEEGITSAKAISVISAAKPEEKGSPGRGSAPPTPPGTPAFSFSPAPKSVAPAPLFSFATTASSSAASSPALTSGPGTSTPPPFESKESTQVPTEGAGTGRANGATEGPTVALDGVTTMAGVSSSGSPSVGATVGASSIYGAGSSTRSSGSGSMPPASAPAASFGTGGFSSPGPVSFSFGAKMEDSPGSDGREKPPPAKRAAKRGFRDEEGGEGAMLGWKRAGNEGAKEGGETPQQPGESPGAASGAMPEQKAPSSSAFVFGAPGEVPAGASPVPLFSSGAGSSSPGSASAAAALSSFSASSSIFAFGNTPSAAPSSPSLGLTPSKPQAASPSVPAPAFLFGAASASPAVTTTTSSTPSAGFGSSPSSAPGAATSPSTTGFHFGSAPSGAPAASSPALSQGFAFGASSGAQTSSPPSTGGFLFGAQPPGTQAALTGTATGGFSFKAAAASAASSPGLTFGAPPASGASSGGGFTFKSSASGAASGASTGPAFTFGAAAQSPSATGGPGPFLFGASAPASSSASASAPFAFGGGASGSAPASSPMFSFGGQSASAPFNSSSPSSAPAFTFGGSSQASSAAPSGSFVFGSGAGATAQSQAPGFSFGGGGSGATGPGTAPSGFAFGSSSGAASPSAATAPFQLGSSPASNQAQAFGFSFGSGNQPSAAPVYPGFGASTNGGMMNNGGASAMEDNAMTEEPAGQSMAPPAFGASAFGAPAQAHSQPGPFAFNANQQPVFGAPTPVAAPFGSFPGTNPSGFGQQQQGPQQPLQPAAPFGMPGGGVASLLVLGIPTSTMGGALSGQRSQVPAGSRVEELGKQF